ncbi:DUF6896 domain-containing protein [Actinacidiphila bryophytorum]|uniref:DUF6896 domain-containing protein n=1 Tax=Actinacidiphila bryophytorum TaxID=1436133 RepID=UPI002176ACD8|nr:hypothetical protein [Actinacidiphila bryophytorum]UWE13461.1 hypothetical protein NYE86_35530 [Actinacidiphila bryophytorum]
MGRSWGDSYQVHGAGCLFVGSDGAEIDVDFMDGGREVFDVWRLLRYGRSLSEPCELAEQDVRLALESLGSLLVEVRPGWFGVAETRASG